MSYNSFQITQIIRALLNDQPIPDNIAYENIPVALLQKMNFHISNLPHAPKCPDAPLLPPSLRLPNVI